MWDPSHSAGIVSSGINYTIFSFVMLSYNKKSTYFGVTFLHLSKTSTIDSPNLRKLKIFGFIEQ